MIIFRVVHLIFLFVRYNCFFIFGIAKIFPYSLSQHFYDATSKKQAVRLVSFLSNSGSLFVKLGQVLATRVDIFSEVFITELKTLRDSIEFQDNGLLRKIVEAELGQKLEDVFLEVNNTPVASASIASVYQGTLKNGEVVAIKIIKPKVVKQIWVDIRILRFIFTLIQSLTKYGRISKPIKIINNLEKVIKMELDLRFEAASIDEIRNSVDKDMYVPKIYWDYVTKNLLIEEWIDGIRIGDKEKLVKNGFDLTDITRKMTKIFFLQTLKNGFFHGDIHSGNIMVLKDGRIAFIDFGIMGRLDKKARKYLKDLFVAFLNKDYLKAANIHFENGWISNKYTPEEFSLACRSIVEKILYLPQKDIMLGRLLEQLFSISQMFEMEVQEELLLLQKNLIYLESIGRTLTPEENMWVISKDILAKISKETLHEEIKSQVSSFIADFQLMKKSLLSMAQNNHNKYNSNSKNSNIIIIFLLFVILWQLFN